MTHPQWWLIVVAFLLGLVLTFASMIRRVSRDVPVGASVVRPDKPVGTPTEVSRRRWPWWTLGGVLLLVGVVIAGTSVVGERHRGGSASSAASPAVPVAAPLLAGLLLTADQVAGVVGAAHMDTVADGSALTLDDQREIADADCLSAWNAGQHSVYAGTGETGVHSQALRAEEKPVRHFANQAVIAYPTAIAAVRVVANQFAQWSACSGRTVTSTPPPPRTPRLFTFGPVTHTGGILSMTQTSVDNAIWGCQRALAARSNVVIDIRACRPDTTNQAVDILDGIAAKIPH